MQGFWGLQGEFILSMKIKKSYTKFCLFGLALGLACTSERNFPSIGMSWSGPSAVEVSSDGQNFYVQNSDFGWVYNSGSIVTLNEAGDKLSALEAPRLGSGLKIVTYQGRQRLIGIYDIQSKNSTGYVQTYDLTDQAAPVQESSVGIACSPLKIIAEDSYRYFFVACTGGNLYVGDLESSSLEMKLIRSYGRTRRAWYLSVSKQLLVGFPTDLGRQGSEDRRVEDVKTFSSTGEETAGANEVPDLFEETKESRRQRRLRSLYQFVVMDLATESSAGFPLRNLGDSEDSTATLEARWLYFNLFDADGQPDNSDDIKTKDFKNYRTNFFEASPHPTDSNSFYLSHRGVTAASTNVVKVSFLGPSLVPVEAVNGICGENTNLVEDKCVPTTESVLNFKRVYGFNSEVDDLHYPGMIESVVLGEQEILVVNHFRDFPTWRNKVRFSIAAKTVGRDSVKAISFDSTSQDFSIYGFAINSSGVLMAPAYYGDAVIRMVVGPNSIQAPERKE